MNEKKKRCCCLLLLLHRFLHLHQRRSSNSNSISRLILSSSSSCFSSSSSSFFVFLASLLLSGLIPKDFAAAVQTFLPLATAQPQNDIAIFSLANAYFNQNPPKLDLAKQQFQKITDANATVYVPKAQWYLALIALKKGNLEQAEKLLKKVVASGDDIAKKAGNLLKELE